MKNTKQYDVIIVGGGFFGLSIAQYCHDELMQEEVLVLEKENDFMSRASYKNQARVHGGYHYPRSLLTALRSQVNFDRFVKQYEPAIMSDFDMFYAIARTFSKVTAKQFQLFCERIGADIKSAPDMIKGRFNPALVEDVFKVKEYAFDSNILKQKLVEDLTCSGVVMKTGEEVYSVHEEGDGLVLVAENGRRFKAKHIYNCAYSMINKINLNSNLPIIPLKHELAEMCLVSLPNELSGMSVTIMCGPFFSFMPFPDRQMHTLSHVRYTPHTNWQDDTGKNYLDSHRYLNENANTATHFPQMYNDAIRYIPSLKKIKYEDSLWEIKTVLPRSEENDSRPILFMKNHGLEGYTCIMGGKLDNIYDVFRELDVIYGQ